MFRTLSCKSWQWSRRDCWLLMGHHLWHITQDSCRSHMRSEKAYAQKPLLTRRHLSSKSSFKENTYLGHIWVQSSRSHSYRWNSARHQYIYRVRMGRSSSLQLKYVQTWVLYVRCYTTIFFASFLYVYIFRKQWRKKDAFSWTTINEHGNFFSPRHQITNIKMKLFHSVVIPIALYFSETW